MTDVLYDCASWINGCATRARDDKRPVDTTERVYELVREGLAQSDQEICLVILLDVHMCVRDVVEIAKGKRSSVAVDKVDILKAVINGTATSFILVHSHPSGQARPSKSDREFTKHLEKAAKLFDGETKFLDHVVIGKDQYFSIRENKLHKRGKQ